MGLCSAGERGVVTSAQAARAAPHARVHNLSAVCVALEAYVDAHKVRARAHVHVLLRGLALAHMLDAIARPRQDIRMRWHTDAMHARLSCGPNRVNPQPSGGQRLAAACVAVCPLWCVLHV